MDGLPVVIRLIDPPLHEFLPAHDELLEQVTRLRTLLGAPSVQTDAVADQMSPTLEKGLPRSSARRTRHGR